MYYTMGVLLGPVQRRLMLHLLKHGPKSTQGISLKVNLSWADCERTREDAKLSSHQTIQLRLKELVKKGFLESRDQDEDRFYHLTGFGLAALCVRFLDRPSELCKIIAISYENWIELLPLVLGKWGLFKSEGVDDLACSNLINASHLMIREYYAYMKALWEWVCHKRQRKEVVEPRVSTDSDTFGWFLFSSGPKQPGFPSKTQQVDAFHQRFYVFENPALATENSQRWLLACKKDEAIIIYLREQLQAKVDSRAKQLERLQTTLMEL
jgi:hypothetical protein